jgi:hypothetical protein
MFNSAVRTLEPYWLAPDAGQGRVINVKVKINRLSSLRAPTNEITHRIAPKSQKNEGYFVAAFLVFGQLEVRFDRNTIDANPKMLGNESSDVVGGQDICDSHGLFNWCHAIDGHG